MKRRKLKTGLPDGTFKSGDPHPTESDYRFNGYSSYNGKHIETWKSNSVRQRGQILKNIRRRKQGKATFSPTSLPRGTFKRGDKHPFAAGKVFREYMKGVERWVTKEKLVEMMASAGSRRANIRESGSSAMIIQLYAYRERLSNCTGIPFHVDHTIPISQGGTHDHSNMQVVPAMWNMIKSNLHCDKWCANMSQ
tara:strand:- start:92 stop:673 length:582 start_codon:yes stop_codon:yes gene_type:complete